MGRVKSSFAAALLFINAIVVGAGCHPTQDLSGMDNADSQTLMCNVGKVIMKAGDSHNLALVIHNKSTKAIRAVKFETSCDCVTIRPEQVVIPAGGATTVYADLDMSHEPEFHGGLGVHVYMLDGRASRRLVTVVEIDVTP